MDACDNARDLPALTGWRIRLVSSVLLALLGGAPTPSGAQEPHATGLPRATAALIDSVLAAARERHGVPGAVVAVVHDTAVFLGASGFADAERDLPADPLTSLFPTASVSKVVTGSTVLQLAARGVLDLDGDIRTHLEPDFPLPPGDPITLRHLLTHTGGFDDRYIGKSSSREETPEEFARFLRGFVPARVEAPGHISSYSNYGIALAAYVAQRAAGAEDFSALVDAEILAPLGMRRSSFRPPRDDLATGYIHDGGTPRPIDRLWARDYPAGEFATTAAEFARFMRAHLDHGRLGGEPVIAPEAIEAMHALQFTHHPALAGGMGMVFQHTSHAGRPLLVHDGGFPGMAARLWLLPEERIGIFIAANLLSQGFLWDVSTALLDHLPVDDDASAPASASTAAPAPGSASVGAPDGAAAAGADPSRFAGTYRLTRYPRATFDKVALLVGGIPGEMKIDALPDGHLRMPDHLGRPRRLAPAAPLVFTSLDDDYVLAFGEDEAGRITHAFTSGATAMERVGRAGTLSVQRVFLLGAQGVFVALLVMLLVSRGKEPGIGRSGPLWSRIRVRTGAGIVSGLFLAHTLALALVLGLLTPPEILFGGFPLGAAPALYAVQALSVVGVVALVAMAVPWLAAALRFRSAPGRAAAAVAALAFFGLYALALDYWNLLGWRF